MASRPLNPWTRCNAVTAVAIASIGIMATATAGIGIAITTGIGTATTTITDITTTTGRITIIITIGIDGVAGGRDERPAMTGPAVA